MKDSRVDWVADLVKDARLCVDPVTQQVFVEQAVNDWQWLADEFPPTDSVVSVVSVRLVLALHELKADNRPAALISLQLAAAGIQEVQDR